jgi:Clp amino terminal domain, pathogenicity island component
MGCIVQSEVFRQAAEAAMYERFTARARKVMQLANQEAQRFNHEYIGTEHILLGLVKEGLGVAANVLKKLGIDLRTLRLEVGNLVRPGPAMITFGKLPISPCSRNALEYSIEEARKLNHSYVGTEHLLLGLLRDQEGMAALVLRIFGVTLQQVREVVLHAFANPDEFALVPPVEFWEIGKQPAPAPTPGDGEFDEPLTDSALRAMELAACEARTLGCELVGTEHVLLGIVSEGTGTAAEALKELGGDLDKLRAALQTLAPPGPYMVPIGKAAYTSLARTALSFAAEEARSLCQVRVDTQHLLLGLLRESSGQAVKVLKQTGIDLDEFRKRILAYVRAATHECQDPNCRWRNGPVMQWLMATECRLLKDQSLVGQEKGWLGVRMGFGAIVGATVAGTAYGPQGTPIGLVVGCLASFLGWFAPAALLGSLVGASIGKSFAGFDEGILAGAMLGTAVAALVVEWTSKLYGRLAQPIERPGSRKA